MRTDLKEGLIPSPETAEAVGRMAGGCSMRIQERHARGHASPRWYGRMDASEAACGSLSGGRLASGALCQDDVRRGGEFELLSAASEEDVGEVGGVDARWISVFGEATQSDHARFKAGERWWAVAGVSGSGERIRGEDGTAADSVAAVAGVRCGDCAGVFYDTARVARWGCGFGAAACFVVYIGCGSSAVRV